VAASLDGNPSWEEIAGVALTTTDVKSFILGVRPQSSTHAGMKDPQDAKEDAALANSSKPAVKHSRTAKIQPGGKGSGSWTGSGQL
jgi:hypothetical protein